MKKTGTFLSASFLLCSILTVVIVASMYSNDVWVDIVISVMSIIVTIILGYTTYVQTKSQYDLDMIEKIPYFATVDFLCDPAKEQITSHMLEIPNSKVLRIRAGYGNGKVSLPINFVNTTNTTVLSIMPYYVSKDSSGKYQFHLCKGHTSLNNRLNDPDFSDNVHAKLKRCSTLYRALYQDIMPNAKFSLMIDLPYTAEMLAETKDQTIPLQFFLESKTVFGYEYVQCFHILAIPETASTGLLHMGVVSYDVCLIPGNSKSKRCRKQIIRYFSK